MRVPMPVLSSIRSVLVFTRPSQSGDVSYLRLLSLLHERILTLLLPALLVPGEVFWASDLIQGLLVKSTDVDFRRCSDHVSSVHSSDGHSVDFEGTGD